MPDAPRSRRMSVVYLIRLAALLIAAFAAWRFFTWPERPFNVQFDADTQHRIARVIDGDTLELANGDRVRLIGIDTPEFSDGVPEPFAVEATEFASQLVSGKTVRLQFDKERVDKYRRVLAFVYVGDTLVNEELVRAGLARVLTRFEYSSRMKKRLLKAQSEAKREELNLWRPTS